MDDETATKPTEPRATARLTLAEAPAPSGPFSSLRSTTIGRLLLTIPVLLAAMLPASAAATPPQPVSPPNGASFTANTPIRFEVSSQPNDPSVLIQISRFLNIDPRTGILWTPDVYYFDVAKESKPASGVYEWTPPSFIWKDPGTYYWQPFHVIPYAGEPDGRIEGSAVRSLQIALPPSAPPQTATPPAPQAAPAPQKSQAKSKPKKKKGKRNSHAKKKR